ncbi:hypothetical protein [Paenibacillus sp. UNC451MF]|uniref:hypothetical protein n=1 Tax=Paenibacillus sp. UNC451MF TaxID=1449063 RepID=UPI00048FC2F7|nr:hypothetical protein [Paenibacillus sp. UNC451MF]
MISFTFEIRNIEFHYLKEKVEIEGVISHLKTLEGIHYQLSCYSSANNYQRVSNLDEVLKEKLGSRQTLSPNIPAKLGIDYDIVTTINNSRTIIEIEKANKEKILYDLLKAHVYLNENKDIFILIVPKEWIHSKGKEFLFQLAIERFEMCIEYGMCNKDVMSRTIIMGYDQFIDSKQLTRTEYNHIVEKCREFLS